MNSWKSTYRPSCCEQFSEGGREQYRRLLIYENVIVCEGGINCCARIRMMKIFIFLKIILIISSSICIFSAVQNDCSYRAEWDKNVIKLEMVKDDGLNEQVSHSLYCTIQLSIRKTLFSQFGFGFFVCVSSRSQCCDIFYFNFYGVLQIRSLCIKKVELQLIRWVARYPYPLYPREYVYVKRSVVSDDGKDIVIQSKALPESVSYQQYTFHFLQRR